MFLGVDVVDELLGFLVREFQLLTARQQNRGSSTFALNFDGTDVLGTEESLFRTSRVVQVDVTSHETSDRL
jgi:hypothetical protein